MDSEQAQTIGIIFTLGACYEQNFPTVGIIPWFPAHAKTGQSNSVITLTVLFQADHS